MSSETSPAPADAEALVVVDGMTPGMPLGPSLRLTNPELHVSVFGGTQRPPDADWATVPLVAIADLPAPARAAVDRTIAEHVGDAPWPARRPPWFRHGWLEHVEDWIDDQLRSLTLVRARATVPVRVWSLSAVLQVPLTSRASVWFKATCEHFRAEPAITRAVGAFATSTVPTVLAADDDRAWMLLAPLPPTAVDRARRIEATASAMAKVQLEATAHMDALRAAGCPDRGLQPTLDAFRALLAARESAARIWSWIEDQLGSFFDGGIPLSLVHGDLHLDNVAGDDRAVIYDWTDGCISHPFIDGAHLAREADGAHHAAVRDIYLAAWGNGAEATWELAPLADRVFQAVTHDAIRRSLEPASQWEVAGWMARLLVDLEQAFLVTVKWETFAGAAPYLTAAASVSGTATAPIHVSEHCGPSPPRAASKECRLSPGASVRRRGSPTLACGTRRRSEPRVRETAVAASELDSDSGVATC